MVGKRRLVVVVKMGDLRMVSYMWAGKKGSSPCPHEFFLSSSQPTRANYSMSNSPHTEYLVLSAPQGASRV